MARLPRAAHAEPQLLCEPELEFAAGGRHLDVRFGLLNYGPLDRDSLRARREIKVGMIGTAETIEGLQRWLGKCAAGVDAKESRQPNLFPRFPGFGAACETSGYACSRSGRATPNRGASRSSTSYAARRWSSE